MTEIKHQLIANKIRNHNVAAAKAQYTGRSSELRARKRRQCHSPAKIGGLKSRMLLPELKTAANIVLSNGLRTITSSNE